MLVQDLGTDIDYTTALEMQERAVAGILNGEEEQVFLLEHMPVFTAGSSAQTADVLETGDIPVIHTGRGGRVTYHGPGQLVCYPVLDLKYRQQDLRWYVHQLQELMIAVLAEFGVKGEICDDVGVWVGNDKIAAIGIRVRKWVTFHGFALNVNPDLEAYRRIVPCGIADRGITSLHKLGIDATMADVKAVLSEKMPVFLSRTA